MKEPERLEPEHYQRVRKRYRTVVIIFTAYHLELISSC